MSIRAMRIDNEGIAYGGVDFVDSESGVEIGKWSDRGPDLYFVLSGPKQRMNTSDECAPKLLKERFLQSYSFRYWSRKSRPNLQNTCRNRGRDEGIQRADPRVYDPRRCLA